MRPLPWFLPGSRLWAGAAAGEKTPESPGFTLVEVIAALVVLGFLGVLAGLGSAKVFQGYVFTRDNAGTALKGRAALARIVKELRALDSISLSSETALHYTFIKDGVPSSNRTLHLVDGTEGASLMLGDYILADGVADFSLSYHAGYNDAGDASWSTGDTLIGITLGLTGASGTVSTVSARVAPRNL